MRLGRIELCELMWLHISNWLIMQDIAETRCEPKFVIN